MVNQFLQTLRAKLPGAWAASRTVILTSAVVTASLIGIRQLGVLQPLELAGFDQLMRLHPTQKPDPRLLIVGITDEDIQARKEYPLTDRTILELLETLEQAEPRAIGLDIIRDVPIGKGQKQLLDYMKRSDRLVAVCKVRDQAAAGFPPPPGLELDQVGAANLGVDPDGVLRRALLTITPPNGTPNDSDGAPPPSICDDPSEAIPYFGLQLAILYLGSEGIAPEILSNGFIKLGATVFQPLERNVGPYRSPHIGGQQGYQLLINYRSPRQVAEEVSLTDVLTGKVDPKRIKDRIVLIGYTARSVKDELFTPFTQGQNLPPMPGVVAHGQVVSQLLGSVLDGQPLFWFWNGWSEGVWIFAWSLFGGILAWRIRHPLVLIWAIAGSLPVLFFLSYGFFIQAGWIPLVPPALSFILTIGGVVLFSRGYAQAIYQGVKGLLKLDIAIDVEKKEREVAEITESDYFQELQTKSEQLRRQKAIGADVPPEEATLTPLPDSPPEPIANSANPTELTSPDLTPEEMEFLEHLERRGRERRHKSQPTPPTPLEPDAPASATPGLDFDFLQMLSPKVSEPKMDTPLNLGTVQTPLPAPASGTPSPALDGDFLEQVQRHVEARRQHPQLESLEALEETLEPDIEQPSVEDEPVPIAAEPSPNPDPLPLSNLTINPAVIELLTQERLPLVELSNTTTPSDSEPATSLDSASSSPPASLSDLLHEVDEYYQKLKQQ